MKTIKVLSALVLSSISLVASAQVTPNGTEYNPEGGSYAGVHGTPLTVLWTAYATTTGDVTATISSFDFRPDGSQPVFTDNLFASNGDGSTAYLGTNKSIGTSVDLGVFQKGQQIILALQNGIGQTFFSGVTTANFDGQDHANVYQKGSSAVFDFEDETFTGNGVSTGDWNYGDATVSLSNATAQPAPEPFTIGIGIAAVGAVIRKRRKA